MSLLEQLNEDLKQAMKSGDKVAKGVIQMVKAQATNESIDLKRSLTDNEVIKIITTKIKQTKDVMTDFQKAGRQDLIDASEAEISVLQEYLPRQLTEGELAFLIIETAEKVGAKTKADKGKLMKELKPLTENKAEGKLVSEMVDKLLLGITI